MSALAVDHWRGQQSFHYTHVKAREWARVIRASYEGRGQVWGML